MGYLAASVDLSLPSLRRAMAYGTVVASYNIEAFSLGRLMQITRADLDRRLAEVPQDARHRGVRRGSEKRIYHQDTKSTKGRKGGREGEGWVPRTAQRVPERSTCVSSRGPTRTHDCARVLAPLCVAPIRALASPARSSACPRRLASRLSTHITSGPADRPDSA